MIKYIPPKTGKMITFGSSQGHTLLPFPWRRHPLASNTTLLSINQVAKCGSEALVGRVRGCPGLPRPRQPLPPCRQAGGRQSAANRLLVQAININKAIRNPTALQSVHFSPGQLCVFHTVTLSSGCFSSTSSRALHK